MQIDTDKLEVIHNPAEHRFEVWVDNALSKLDYLRDGNTIVMTHVGVPQELRGAGIAGRLTQFALEYAGAESLRVIPMCSYVAAYLRKHPQYQKLVKG
jgi:uncharacterized protein